jgi:hypothetical protein
MWAAKEEIPAVVGTAAAPDKPLDTQPAVGVVEPATFGWAVNLFPIESLLPAGAEVPVLCTLGISVLQVPDKAAEILEQAQETFSMEMQLLQVELVATKIPVSMVA